MLAPRGAHRRCNLDDGDLVRVLECLAHLEQVVALAQGANRTVGDALAAQDAVGLLDAAVVGDVNRGTSARAGQLPDTQSLNLLTVLDTAHALDALSRVAVEREGRRPQTARQLLLIRIAQDAEVVGDRLQTAVARADTGGAGAVVLRQNQLDIDAACLTGARGVGVDDHALVDEVVAGGDQTALALDLDTADAAGADLVDVLEIAQGRDRDAGLSGGLHDRGALRYADGDIVDDDVNHSLVYHCLILPPRKLP